DGPTGLGTPNGVASLSSQYGEVVGTVAATDTGDPLDGVTVTATGGEDERSCSATTGADGGYVLHAPAGSYDLTASKFGFASSTTDDVRIDTGARAHQDFTLASVPSQQLSGTVTDGSGHGWPLRAEITIDGYPGGAVFSDPYTGHYSVDLPVGATYSLHVSAADLPAYADTDLTVDMTAGHNTHQPIHLKVDTRTCRAPGYAYSYDGPSTDFEGWPGETPQDGWTVTDDAGTGKVWRFDDPGHKGNRTGGTGSFAIVDGWYYPDAHDTSLVSPSLDLTGVANPEIGFDTDYSDWSDTDSAEVYLSTDDGATWTRVWHQSDEDVQGHVAIPVPDVAGASGVRVKFRYVGQYDNWWQLDNIYVGSRSCEPTPGGLVEGVVRDDNTGDPLNGATLTSGASAEQPAVTTATPDDVSVPDGFYWLYSPAKDRTALTVAKGVYTTAHGDVGVPTDFVAHKDWRLRAGHLTVSTQNVSVQKRLGRSATRKVTFGNDGTEPVHVRLAEQDNGFTPMGGAHQATTPGAPTQRLKGKVTFGPASDRPIRSGTRMGRSNGDTVQLGDQTVQLATGGSAGNAWSTVADYPTPIMDNVVAARAGKAYSVGGTTRGSGAVSAGNVYDPATQRWSSIADLPQARQAAAGEFVGGTLYVAGGWDESGESTASTYAYHPGSDSWSKRADMPEPLAGGASAVLNGELYVVGGCGSGCASESSAVYSYSPESDTWTRHADYPKPVAFESCAGLGGKVVCAGGVEVQSSYKYDDTYIYDPATDTWTRGSSIPSSVAGAASTGANGKLQLAGGVVDDLVSNESFEYDPATDSWSSLPNANHALYRGGGACGLYRVGGAVEHFEATPYAGLLSGYDQCLAGEDVSWLSANTTEFDVAPGATVTVRVALDSSVLAQPGEYRAGLAVVTDSPYRMQPVDVGMTVNPPKRWGKIGGTVTDTDGAPIGGATVQVCTMYRHGSGRCGPVTYTLKTDSRGHFQL
ncbi:MAG: Kelch repeat-containing protein, partial [Nocardioidaceae bacterium]